MSQLTSDKRAQAARLLEEASKLGLRKELKAAIDHALALARGDAIAELTDLQYRKLAPGQRLADPQRRGLIMKASKTGKRWIFRTERPGTGKQVEITLGHYPVLGVAEARRAWDEARAKREAGTLFDRTTRQHSDKTVGWLVRTYLDKYAAITKRPSSAETDRRLLSKYILPHYAGQPIAAFDTATVAKILSPLHARAPREAEKLRAVLSTMFNVASGRTKKINMLDGTWLAPDHPNPVDGAQLPLHKAKSHKPTRMELRSYLRGLDTLGTVGSVLRLQIQTFARISEIAELPWSEIDLDEAVWTLPAVRAKNDRQHRVMLSKQSVALLRAVQVDSDSPWVFPRKSDPTVAMGSAYVQRTLLVHRETLGVTVPELDPSTGKTIVAGFTTHSVRHAGLTWLQASGAGRDVRDRVSNHAPPGDGADHIYAGASLDQPARQWTQKWADHLTSLEAENVVQLSDVTA